MRIRWHVDSTKAVARAPLRPPRPPHVAAEERDISGGYAMKGTSLRTPGPYEGTCTLTRNDKVYNVNCVNTGSGDTYVGRGLVRGGHFSLYLGEYLVVYRIQDDGRLVGNWTHSRSDDYGEELLTAQ